jgi:pimeloyl-ACP methyl ester carboxylesterase
MITLGVDAHKRMHVAVAVVGWARVAGTFERQTAFARMFSKAGSDVRAPGVAGAANIASVLLMLSQWTPAMIANDALGRGCRRRTPSPPELARHAGRAVIEYDARLEALAGITAPALVLGLELDVLTPAALGREVADAIKGARYRGDRRSHAPRSLHAYKPDYGRSAAVPERGSSCGS